MSRYLAFATVLSLSACGLGESAPNDTRRGFFDLGDYFKTEIQRLQSEVDTVSKTAILQGKSEEKKVVISDWQSELAFFSQSDINKPAWWEKYTVDSMRNDAGQLVELRYETSDPQLRTHKLDIKFEQGAVHSILIVNHIENGVYHTEEFLEYIPQRGYTVAKGQSVVLHEKGEYEVKVLFGG